MTKIMIAAGAFGLLTLGAAAPASATITTFATISPQTTDNLYFKNAASNGKSTSATVYSIGSASSTVPGSTLVTFSFINVSSFLSGAVSNVNALFTFNGAVVNTSAQSAFGYLIQPGVSGSFSFISTTAITVGNTTYSAGKNLLSATFTNAGIAGPSGGSSGSMDASTNNGGTLVFTSDFLTFGPGDGLDASFNLGSIVPGLSRATGGSYALNTFKTNVGGSFSADPAPTITASVPEPATWAMMLGGFGMVGFGLRRRRKNTLRVTYA